MYRRQGVADGERMSARIIVVGHAFEPVKYDASDTRKQLQALRTARPDLAAVDVYTWCALRAIQFADVDAIILIAGAYWGGVLLRAEDIPAVMLLCDWLRAAGVDTCGADISIADLQAEHWTDV